MTSYKVYFQERTRTDLTAGGIAKKGVGGVANMVANAALQGGSIGRHRKEHLGRWFLRFLVALVGECQGVHEDGWM